MNVIEFLSVFDRWTLGNDQLISVAIVGSHARGDARPESDIDLLLLTDTPESFVSELSWLEHLGPYHSVSHEQWGPVTTLRVFFDELEVEFGFVPTYWAGIPVDPGTANVVTDGLTLIKDSNNLLANLVAAVAEDKVVNIRTHLPGDAQILADIFYAAVQNIPDTLYSAAQKDAWANKPDKETYRFWQQRIENKRPFVAEYQGRVAGFIELDIDGHIDCFYIDPQHQKLGIGGQLYQQVLNEAHAFGLNKLYVEASKAAHSFFIRRGFQLITENDVAVGDQHLKNYLMELVLNNR